MPVGAYDRCPPRLTSRKQGLWGGALGAAERQRGTVGEHAVDVDHAGLDICKHGGREEVAVAGSARDQRCPASNGPRDLVVREVPRHDAQQNTHGALANDRGARTSLGQVDRLVKA